MEPFGPFTAGETFRRIEHMFETCLDELEEVLGRLATDMHRLDGSGMPADGRSMARVLGALDRFRAIAAEAQVRFDVVEGWRDDGAVSLRGWLTGTAGLDRTAAATSARRTERLEVWPAVADAWVAGRLSGAMVDAIVAAVPARFVRRFADDAAVVVEVVAPLDAAGVATAMRQWVRCAESEDGPEDLRDRPSGVFVSSFADGRVAISGELSPVEGSIVDAALRVFDVPDTFDDVGELVGERRSIAQRNADALVAMSRFALDHRDGGGERGRFVPHVSLVVDIAEARASALRGAGVRTVDEVHARAVEKGWTAVETAWFVDAVTHHGDAVTSEGQLLDAAAISALGCDSVMQRVLLSGSRVLDLGREERTAPHWQRRAVVARDRHCRAPGCRTTARFCEVHHVDHWAEGGRTSVDRMVLLCGSHHREFHKEGYRMELDDDATFTVHSPRGWRRSTVPERREEVVFPLRRA